MHVKTMRAMIGTGRPLRLALALAALLALSACVKLERQAVDKRMFALDVARPAQTALATPLRPEALVVRRLAVSPRYSGREMVFRQAESRWNSDYYNVFFVSPADMLTQDLRAWLGAAGLFANVVDPGSLLAPGFVLEGSVSSFYGDLAGTPGQAVFEVQFLLLREGGAERTVALARTYRKSEPLGAASAPELAQALRRAVASAYADLEADMRAALAPGKERTPRNAP